jgi:hypothetical protein
MKLLSIIALVCLMSCGSVAPDKLEQKQGAVSTFTGGYSCGGTYWYTYQLATNTYHRGAFGFQSYYTLEMDYGAAPSVQTYNTVTLVCPNVKFPASPTCNTNGTVCNDPAVVCQLYDKPAGQYNWDFSSDIDIEYKWAAYYPAGASYTFPMVAHNHTLSNGGTGAGLLACDGEYTHVFYNFH